MVYYFYFSSLKVLKHYFLASLVSTEKLAISLVALKVMRVFLSCVFNFQHFEYDAPRCGFNCLYSFQCSYSWICALISLVNLGKFSVVISTIIALVLSLTQLLLELNYTHIRLFDNVSHVPSVVFFPLLFLSLLYFNLDLKKKN